MTGPTKREIERRLETLRDDLADVGAPGDRHILELPEWVVAELESLDDPADLSAEAAAAVRVADLEQMGAGE